jgi:hypothetical protein
MIDISDAMSKVRSGEPGEAADACCFLAKEIGGSGAAMAAVMSYVWDKKRYKDGVGRAITAYLPNPSLTDVVHKHHDQDFRISAMDQLEHGGALGAIDARLIDDPMVKGVLSAKTGAAPESAEVAEFAKRHFFAINDMRSLLGLMESHPGESDAKLASGLVREHGAKAIPALVAVVSRRGGSDLVSGRLLDEAAELLSSCEPQILASLVASLGEGAARRLVRALRRATGEPQHELEYLLAKKVGDMDGAIECLAKHPSRRDDAISLVLTPGSHQAKAVRELLPVVFGLLDDDAFAGLWSNDNLKPSILQAVGERMPTGALARLALGADKAVAASAVGALSRKGANRASRCLGDREI